MKTYIVIWEMEIEAENKLEAAELAREIQKDPESVATVFTVQDTEDKSVETLDSDPECLLDYKTPNWIVNGLKFR